MSNKSSVPTISEQLNEHCEKYLNIIGSRALSRIPTNNIQTITCDNDVFDAIVVNANTVATSHKAVSQILLWDLTTASLLRTIEVNDSQNWELLSISHSHILVGSYLSKSVKVVNWHTSLVERTITLETSIMYYGHRVLKAFGRQNDLIIAGLENNKLVIFDLSGTFVMTFSGHTRGVTCVEIIPKGRIITGSWDTSLKMWDVQTCSCVKTFTGHNGPITSVCLLDERRIVSGSYDYHIKMWDIESAVCVAEIGQCNDWIREIITLTPKLICSASDDKKVRIWNVDDMQCVQVLTGHTGCVHSVVLHDEMLISGSSDHTVRIWR
jgi:WD40 repeat protein